MPGPQATILVWVSSGWEVVAEACDGKEAIDVAIIDYSLPMMNGVEATRQIRARVPAAEVLIFTMHNSEVLVGELLEAGARAYVLKSDANQYLLAAVESLANHKPFFYRKGLGTIARYIPRQGTRQARRCLVAAGTRDRSIDRGRSHQQGND